MVRNSAFAALIVIMIVWLLPADTAAAQNLKDMSNSGINQIRLNDALQASESGIEGHENSITEEQRKQIKRRKSQAFLRSVVLPGWGQLREGNKRRAYGFMAAEVILISGIVGLRTHAAWLEDDYKQFAQQHAGIDDDYDHQFYVDIGNYDDRESYNERRLRDRNYEAIYTTSRYDWKWDSTDNRKHFEEMRISADDSKQMSILLVGGILFNHLLAGIEATQSVKMPDENLSLRVSTLHKTPLLNIGYRLDIMP